MTRNCKKKHPPSSFTYHCFLTSPYNNGLFFDRNISEKTAVGTKSNAANFEGMHKRAVNIELRCAQPPLQQTHTTLMLDGSQCSLKYKPTNCQL